MESIYKSSYSAIFRVRLYAILFILLALCVVSSSADALSKEQKKVLQSGIPYFNVEDTARACQSSGSALVGSENAEKIYNYFISKGLTPVQTAGFMGNLQAESGFDPGIQEIKPIAGRGGYGLAQWTGGRRVALEAAAASKNVAINDIGFQLDFLWSELEGSYKRSVLDPLRATNDLREATKIVLFEFESPLNEESKLQSRYQLSLGILTKYGGSGAPTTASPNSIVTSCNGSAGGGIVTNGYSLPVDEKFYIENEWWFTKDHHLGKGGVQNLASDIPVPTGTIVYSMTDGKIIKAPNESGYGQGVTIDAGNGVIFIYGHGTDGGSYPNAKQGDIVKAGQPIMHSGNTGFSKGPHLHVEIQVNGQDRCPQPLFVGIFEKNVPAISSLPSSGCSSGEIIYR